MPRVLGGGSRPDRGEMHREGLLNVRKGAWSTVGVDTPSLTLACHRLDERRDARYSRRKILEH